MILGSLRLTADPPFLALVATLCGGCAHPGPVDAGPRADPAHPAALVAGWIDLAHTTRADSLIWVLAPSGDDDNLHISVAVDGPGGSRTGTSVKHYGRWYLDGNLAIPGSRRLCFARRQGRHGSSCVEFTVDTVVLAGVPHRRLLLKRYQGEHHTRDRELLERVGATSR